jgi:hypothetical protein
MQDWEKVFSNFKLIVFPDMAHMLVAPTEKQREIMEQLAKQINS